MKDQTDILTAIAADIYVYKDCNQFGFKKPGMFTNVGKYVPWIKTEIEDDERRNKFKRLSKDKCSVSIIIKNLGSYTLDINLELFCPITM